MTEKNDNIPTYRSPTTADLEYHKIGKVLEMLEFPDQNLAFLISEYHNDYGTNIDCYTWHFDPDQNDFDYGKSQKEITVAECYLYLDIDGDGISEYVKVTVAGSSNPTAVLGIEEIDCCPFVSTTAILMSHKFFGLSIFDRLWQIQDHKTALWRNTMDNIYMERKKNVVRIQIPKLIGYELIEVISEF